MSTVELLPVSDVAATWSCSSGTSRFELVNELLGDQNEADYIYKSLTSTGTSSQFFHLSAIDIDNNIPAGSTINSVTINIRSAVSSGATTKAEINTGFAAKLGTARTGTSYADYTDTFTTSVLDAAWTIAILKDNRYGIRLTYGGTGTKTGYCASFSVTIAYTLPQHRKPTGLQCEIQTNPTQVSEFPVFSAIFNGNTSAVADSAYAIVSMSPNFTSTSTLWVASSGWVNIPQVATATRSGLIYWDDTGAGKTGSWIRADGLITWATDGNYYWKIKFKTASDGTESQWSDTARFGADILRRWADTSCVFRRKLLFNTNHPQLTPSYTAEFTFKTGNRKVLANDGAFNEAIQNSGGFQIATYQNKTHITYLSKPQFVGKLNYGIKVVSINNLTGERGEPYFLSHDYAPTGAELDTHYFPVICADEDGYLHVFFGCHGSSIKYLRSKYPNNSGSLSDDSSTGVWINPSHTPYDNQSTPLSMGNSDDASYPIGFSIPTDDRVYVVYRYGSYGTGGKNPYSYAFFYSTNNGVDWSSAYGIIRDTHAERYRVYLYGLRYDRLRERLHIAWTYEHGSVEAGTRELGVWYAYSDYGATTTGTLSSAGFNYWCWADGEICGATRVIYDSAAGDISDPID